MHNVAAVTVKIRKAALEADVVLQPVGLRQI